MLFLYLDVRLPVRLMMLFIFASKVSCKVNAMPLKRRMVITFNVPLFYLVLAGPSEACSWTA